ncbi:hypothetical protein ExPUPEC61_02946 [Escherichia coli]|nr:hypothetical protein ExPUPEC61_02946 [Escherichia coli]
MIIPLITHVRYRQRLRLLQSDTENAFMQQAFGNGCAGGVDPFAYRALAGGHHICERLLPGAFVIAELVNQLAVGVEQCFD